ncbi:MAG: DUF6370 family protein [Verrucomicrobiales bacterium]|nr:DUF6370 family protein [Verrucomicrobiales bacterium]
MKKLITATLFGAVLAFTALNASAKDTTIKGTATCAKCDLGTASKCTNVLQVKEDGKTVTYLLAGKAGKPWHKNVCKGSKKVEMTGEVSEKDGEKVFTVSEIK